MNKFTLFIVSGKNRPCRTSTRSIEILFGIGLAFLVTGGENVGLLKNSVFRLETAKERLDLTRYTSCTIAGGHG